MSLKSGWWPFIRGGLLALVLSGAATLAVLAQTADNNGQSEAATTGSAGDAVSEARRESDVAVGNADLLDPRQRELADQANAFFEEVDQLSLEARALIDDPQSSEDELQSMRDQLAASRNAVFELQSSRQRTVSELETRIAALGPAPAEGEEEPEEIAQRRAALNAQLASVRVPIVKGQEAYQQLSALVSDADRALIARFSAELLSHGPSPLLPGTWTAAIEEVSSNLIRVVSVVENAILDDAVRNRILRQLPFNLLMVLLGVGITFTLRRRIDAWTEERLQKPRSEQYVALLTGLRSVTRLFVPLVGTGLFFAAIHPGTLIDGGAEVGFFLLPGFALAVIAAGWIGDSFFMPRAGRYRQVPLDGDEARSGARLVMTTGLILAAIMIVSDLVTFWQMSDATLAALQFPLIIFAGLSLWRLAASIERLRIRFNEVEAGVPTEHAAGLGTRFLGILRRIVLLFAVVGPLLAAAGYLAAALYLVVPTIKTLGLIAAGVVVFDLLNRTTKSLNVMRGVPLLETRNGGLMPVFIALAVFLVATPLLGLIWGARPSEIADFFRTLSKGFTLGGVNISLEVAVRFGIMFAIVLALARLAQLLLRLYVMPRTNMDVGAKNAILAGIGYGGFVLALLSAVSAAGLDLSSLAIVAGALSVGIGFGLQTIVSNFVSGIILLIERPIKEGDWIEVGEFSGYVRGVNVRSTQIETFDRASVIVPNQDLIAGSVLNRTYAGMTGRLIVPVGVSYDSNPRVVERILMEIAEGNPLVLEDPAPTVLFMAFGADSLNFEIRCRLRDVNFMMTVRSDMNFEIFERFTEAGICIPFPQRDITIKNLAELVEKAGANQAGSALREA